MKIPVSHLEPGEAELGCYLAASTMKDEKSNHYENDFK